MTDHGFDKERFERFFKGEYSEGEAEYIAEVMSDKNNDKKLKIHLSKQFDEIQAGNDNDDIKLDNILYRIHYNINTRGASSKARTIGHVIRWANLVAAAILLPLIILTGVRYYTDYHSKAETWVEIKAPAWTRAQFSLPDGTTGWLNSNSSIKYNGNFMSDRKVKLEGEAFFDVFKNKKSPFVVNTNEVSLKVLGTRFNVASYENEKNIEVVLEEGKLVFSTSDHSKSYTMKPNDLIVYDKGKDNYSTEVIQPQKYISWTEGKLVFRNDPLDVVARRLERWYNVDIELHMNSAESPRWRATFKDESLEEVLSLMKRSMSVDYSIENQNQQPDDSYTRKKVIITFSN
jgi:transmembrane sensor